MWSLPKRNQQIRSRNFIVLAMKGMRVVFSNSTDLPLKKMYKIHHRLLLEVFRPKVAILYALNF